MRFSTKMVLIPEEMYLKLLNTNSTNLIKNPFVKPNSSFVEDAPIETMLSEMNKIKKNKFKKADIKQLEYNQQFSRMNKLFLEKINKPVKVANVLAPNKSTNNQLNGTQTPPISLENTPFILNKTPPSPVVHSKKERFLTAKNSEFSDDDDLFLEANNSFEEKIIDYIKTKPEEFNLTKDLKVIQPKTNKILSSSSVENILKYYYSDAAYKKKFRKPAGYDVLINKLKNDFYVNTTYFQHGGRHSKIKNLRFKPLLW